MNSSVFSADSLRVMYVCYVYVYEYVRTYVYVCLLCRVVWVFGGAVDGPTEVVTPTLLTRNVIGKLREADAKANAVLKEMGKSQL